VQHLDCRSTNEARNLQGLSLLLNSIHELEETKIFLSEQKSTSKFTFPPSLTYKLSRFALESY